MKIQIKISSKSILFGILLIFSSACVFLTLNETSEQIRPGMTVQVSITTQEKNDVLAVPTTAIKLYQGEKAVRTLTKNGTILYKPVEIGASDDTYIEIVSGVGEGEQIIISEDTSSSGSSSRPSARRC